MKDSQLSLSLLKGEAPPPKKKSSGPPNRMNDLAYRDWMKFQKSFFRYESEQEVVEECIGFFTKARWPDGSPSRSLIVGFTGFDARAVPAPREVESHPHIRSMSALLRTVADAAEQQQKQDFALFDLRALIANRQQLAAFLSQEADAFFASLRSIMVPERYCGVVVGMEEKGGGGFPLPWSVAEAARRHLKLRDEKVGLKGEGEVFYVLFLQASDDERSKGGLLPGRIALSESQTPIPAWIIPRPPPRKYGEVLHPAKYPETLITEFIELFTEPGDRVFDPMVGTGSTVVAATQAGRHGYGLDLSEEFVRIAKRRVDVANAPSLFRPAQEAVVARGDATRLHQVPELRGLIFDYAVTSPPYWSMLSNPGSENQKARRARDLQLTYSENEQDLGNVQEYDDFLRLLEMVYSGVAKQLADGGVLSVVVKNVKREHVLYPLAWDLVARLCSKQGAYEYLGTTLWCQDNVGLKPFAVGIHWVSNTLHQYCLHLRKRG